MYRLRVRSFRIELSVFICCTMVKYRHVRIQGELIVKVVKFRSGLALRRHMPGVTRLRGA